MSESPIKVIPENLNRREALRLCQTTTDIDVIITLSKHDNPEVRKKALREMCPCRVKEDIQDFWKRVLEMVDDPDDDVRQQVMHTLGDGSPQHMEYDILEAMENFTRDPCVKIRRMANKCVNTYNKTKKWNIL